MSHSSIHRIPFPGHEEWYIEGTLERKAGPSAPTGGRPVALILHGALGHRSYLYQRTLPSQLPIDSFRFDFRSNAASPGPAWDYAGFDQDVEDMDVVAEYLRRECGYRVVLVVGHSRGSVVGIKWVGQDAKQRAGRGQAAEVRGLVNVSGRYRMAKVYDISQHMLPHFQSQGHYDWHVRVAGQPVAARVHRGDLERFAAYDSATPAREFPGEVHVLTVHGMQDGVVPTYDGVIYARVFERRRESGGTGTSTMCLIEESDHNHKGHYEEVNETIVRWWKSVEDGTVKGGWAPAWEPAPGEADADAEVERKSKL